MTGEVVQGRFAIGLQGLAELFATKRRDSTTVRNGHAWHLRPCSWSNGVADDAVVVDVHVAVSLGPYANLPRDGCRQRRRENGLAIQEGAYFFAFPFDCTMGCVSHGQGGDRQAVRPQQ
jgi:hypothetical protein